MVINTSDIKKVTWIIGGLILGLLLLWGFDRAGRKTTYIESAEMNLQADGSIAIADNQTFLRQEFQMPYDLFTGIAIKIGTFGRNNNSFWQAELTEKDSGRKIHEWRFNASQVQDGEYYELNADIPERVKPDTAYELSLRAENATGNSALAFYISKGDTYIDGMFYFDGEEMEGDLCFRVDGAEKDRFWIGWYSIFVAVFIAFLWYLFRKYQKGEKIREDKLFLSVCLGILYFALTFLFTRLNMGTFTDESDNIRGGMLIAKGYVLYRDYYAQHTPFAYYLCGFFALLGASSIEQFRLLYFILNAVIWGGLYYRHSHYYGKMQMFLLPVAQVILVMGMFFQGSKIMGDNIQGLCMIVLILEFLRYLEDKELTPSRCLIVSSSIFCSIMSAFVSVFALAPIIISVIVLEIIYWKEKDDYGIKMMFTRYWMLIVYTAIPFMMTLIYFVWNHALRHMYLMAYQFNTIVYKEYQNQFGRVKWKPFVLGIKNYFIAISDNFNKLITANGNEIAVIQMLLTILAGISLVVWGMEEKKRERIFPAICLFLCMSGNAARSSTDFHGAGFYNVAIVFLIMLGAKYVVWKRKVAIALIAALSLYFVQPYVAVIVDNSVYKQRAVETLDKKIIELTDPGDLIFMDAYIHDSIYLLHKERYPANRNCYILPWYMDWFEYDTIADLEEYQPALAIYRPEQEVYGQTNFAPDLNAVMESLYEREGEDSILWKLK